MTKQTKALKTNKVKAPAKQAPAQQSSDLLTVEEVALTLRVDSTTVRRWIAQGTLEAVILPHQGKRQQYRVKRETMDNLLKAPTHAK